MQFSQHITDKMARYRAFYQNPQPGQVLVTIPPYTFDAPPMPGREPMTLDMWQPFRDAEAMAERAVVYEKYYAKLTADVGSDYVPAVSPSYGIGLCSAFLTNAEVIPGKDTTWIHGVLDELSDMDKLRFDENNPWMDFMKRFQKRAIEVSDGEVCVGLFAAMAPSDMANQLRGNELFYDLYDEPDEVRRLLRIAADAVADAYRVLSPYQSCPEGGFATAGMWLPGPGIFLSEDAADLCSPEVYRDFFASHTQYLLDQVGGAYIHHHALGWGVQNEIAQLDDKLRFLEFSWDPNCRRPVDHLDEVIAMAHGKPIQIRCTLADLKKHIEQMCEWRFSVMVNVDTLEEAKEAVRVVHKYSKFG